MATYDAIVIGTGGVGSAAAYHLARRGHRVLGLDRFSHGHDQGSSHGQTRMIRQAYFEHPDYVPLVKEAYKSWDALESEIRTKLFHRIGLLEVGPPDGVLIPGVLASVEKHNLTVDRLSENDIRNRFPMFRSPSGYVGIFENDAGYLLVEQCVLAHLQLAQQHGAELLTDEKVVEWNATSRGITVRTTRAEYSAGQLVVTAGAWSEEVLASLGTSLRILVKHLQWYVSPSSEMQQQRGCPTFFFELPEGCFYGFPQIDHRGVKVAEHSGGVEISHPSRLEQRISQSDQQRLDNFVSGCVAPLTTRSLDHKVCMYTMTPDEHFIVDRHPDHHNVCFAAGLSGHGFKFACILGAALADLATQQTTELPIDFLRANRPGLYKTD
ncbi:MAG: N-methyl-L-tryptophan oxidase [Planctomycetaceae bacterium]|nr:N-methyl-L-tryptophan oxidase [Planctomycetaceae bacterium]MBP62275.1 N-methyl-L-tryptophan oxidase [Planctomycetaceae bacterium]